MAAAAAAQVRQAFEHGRLDLMTDYEFSQFLVRASPTAHKAPP